MNKNLLAIQHSLLSSYDDLYCEKWPFSGKKLSPSEIIAYVIFLSFQNSTLYFANITWLLKSSLYDQTADILIYLQAK